MSYKIQRVGGTIQIEMGIGGPTYNAFKKAIGAARVNSLDTYKKCESCGEKGDLDSFRPSVFVQLHDEVHHLQTEHRQYLEMRKKTNVSYHSGELYRSRRVSEQG